MRLCTYVWIGKYNPRFFNQIKHENKKWLSISNAKQQLWNFENERLTIQSTVDVDGQFTQDIYVFGT